MNFISNWPQLQFLLVFQIICGCNKPGNIVKIYRQEEKFVKKCKFFAMIFEKHQMVGMICLIECMLVLSCEHDSCSSIEKDGNIRKERALLFPPSSTIGVSDIDGDFDVQVNLKRHLK